MVHGSWLGEVNLISGQMQHVQEIALPLVKLPIHAAYSLLKLMQPLTTTLEKLDSVPGVVAS